MSPTSAKSIAIIGASTIGTHILRAFLALPNHPKLTDIGGYVAHVLTNCPLTSPELVNRSLRIEGQSITLTEIAAIYGKRIVYVPDGGQIPAVSAEEAYMKTELQTAAQDGQLSNGWDRKSGMYSPELAPSANRLWPGHVWQTLESTVEKK
ncbi:hypothetical protein BDP27DRAFT_1450243 [Rhodocollybia butyracea]|uniref:NmrA-like domain-containing protein n=1 Tax=Rhodocollybia butyracea TaxID=206335 RepID=A0A9P5U518_9AGAR|nr:hypothetical protein BDP27DRAFT_1450243 [Rhodocollybia butyracea]